MRVIFFVVVILSSCIPKQRESINTIRIELDEQNQFLVNEKFVNADELKKVVLEEKQKIISDGIKAENIKVVVKISASAPISHQGRIQTVLRQLGLRNIEYTEDREKGA
jgi:hypothetical protein